MTRAEPIWSVSSLPASTSGGLPNGLIWPPLSGGGVMSAGSVGKCGRLRLAGGPACSLFRARVPSRCGLLGQEQGEGRAGPRAAGRCHDVRMTSSRQLVSSGSPLEPEIGLSRAVRSGSYVCVAGTAPIAEGGGVAAPGDVYAQSVRCLDIAEQALTEAGASLGDVVRTRVMLTDIGQWREAARAHAQRFAQVRPACTFVEVSRFIDPGWLVEFEVDAIVLD